MRLILLALILFLIACEATTSAPQRERAGERPASHEPKARPGGGSWN